MAVAVRGAGHARITSDDTVLVLGAGTIGLLSAAVARLHTDRVVVSARYDHQRAVAEALGLDVVAESDVQAWGKANKPRVVLETVGGRRRRSTRRSPSCGAAARSSSSARSRAARSTCSSPP